MKKTILKEVDRITYHSLMMELLKIQTRRFDPCFCSGAAFKILSDHLDNNLAALIGTYAYLGHKVCNDGNTPLFGKIFAAEDVGIICAPHERVVEVTEEFFKKGLIKIKKGG